MRFHRRRAGRRFASGTTEDGGGGDLYGQVHEYYDEHAEPVFAYLRRQFHRQPDEECEDVVHETFIKLLEVVQEEPRGIAQPRGWLITTARRLMLKRLRHASVVDRHEPAYLETYVGLAEPNLAIEGHQSAEARVLRRAFRDALRDGLSLMTPLEHECFLAQAHGMSCVEIAAMLGIDERRVGEAVARGAAKVKKCQEGGHRVA